MPHISRRQLLSHFAKLSYPLLVSPLFSAGCSKLAPLERNIFTPETLGSLSPIDRSLPDSESALRFFGDNPTKAHSALWNKTGAIQAAGGIPKPSERRRVIIIGGGISSLASAYLLRDLEPLILEQAACMGGNSKGQSWRGIDYALGAAYFCVPPAGSRVAKLFSELGLTQQYKQVDSGSVVAVNGEIFDNFWTTQKTSHADQTQILNVARYLQGILNEEKNSYPDPGQRQGLNLKEFKRLDSSTLRAHLEHKFGKISPILNSVIEQYCWSAFAASASEVSAASGINFLAAEFGAIGVFPGGNAAVAEALCRRLLNVLPENSLRVNHTVIDLSVNKDSCTVAYFDQDGALKSAECDTVIVACPKFVAAKIIDDLEPRRLKVIKELEYRAYLVANVLLSGRSAIDSYDLYLLGNLGATGINPRKESQDRGVTDVVFANYASGIGNSSVLTLYQAYPYRGGRSDLLGDDTYQAISSRLLNQINSEILPLYGFKSEAIVDIRITRWGHPIPVATPGLVASGKSDLLSAPHRERVFFIEQDNLPLPAIETALGEAFYWTDKIRHS
jgi:protoporphyrinogen oxidase